MRATRTDGAELVRAAQAGDRAALDELVAAHLPMVYTIVRQALDGHPDVDDVAQDIMLRALRQLRKLRSPESFRPWLAAIALRQVGTYQQRANRAAAHTAPLEDAAELPDADARFEGVTHLRVELSAQRRQVQRAGRWLDSDDRTLLSLWWLEVAGQLSRSELAHALGVTVIHAGVRVQRMRAQLDLSRAVVAALDAHPRCPRLDDELSGWDGVPSPLWRKRLARHVRACPVCTRAAGDLVTTDRLLPGLALFPVPATLTAVVLAKSAGEGAAAGGAGMALSGASAAAGKAGVLGQLVPLAAAHPVVATVAAGTLAAGATVGAVQLSSPETSRPATIGAPTAAPRTAVPASPSSAGTGNRILRTGPASLESANAAGRFVTATGDLGGLTEVGPGNTVTARRQATFRVAEGLADAECFSFRVSDGRYLRHSSWRVRLDRNDGTALFRGDATFCPRPGQTAGSVTLEASNYPGWFLRHRGDELWVDQSDNTEDFRADGSFLVRPPLGD
ncbi:sigma-70 family RNA polymerase sigma factor [Actinoplanes aureus]|uniref:Sigma-70 family RNA polymerase sigma factor n=1 Tax=Actinoplanes aureus TaxID=2792083 RepID=A0A931C115_9ACTN|nr:sigma-70 family RNA polymerase sigma factor [Actinoplanes aureus]MBG0561320.1 sigma-70 family RNA polymerase sigma factor [Actinoplanes aureus]